MALEKAARDLRLGVQCNGEDLVVMAMSTRPRGLLSLFACSRKRSLFEHWLYPDP